MRWKVKEYLDQHEKTPYALIQASGLSVNTVYAIVRGKKKGVEFDTLGKLLLGLGQLTGQRVELSDIIEVSR